MGLGKEMHLKLSSEDSSQPSLLHLLAMMGGAHHCQEPIIAPQAGSPTLPPSIQLLAMMSPFLLHLKVQPAEWPVASLGAKGTPLHRLQGRCPCELIWLCSAVYLPLLSH